VLELLFALGVSLVLAAAAIPQLLAGLDDARARAAARFFASRFMLARADAVARAATVAIRFAGEGGSVAFAAYVDGDADGVRSADIADGTDVLLDAPVRVGDLFPGVATTVAFGTSDLVSFTPEGTASSGTLVLRGRDGSRYAVRVLGATARTRVLRFDPRRDDFVDLY
jgi:Tfp pilus assembly protein FimT